MRKKMSNETEAQSEETTEQPDVDLDAVNAQLEADLSAALDRVATLEAAFESNEQAREDELAVATEGYEALFTKAATIANEQLAKPSELLGIAGQCARDGIISTLESIFGDDFYVVTPEPEPEAEPEPEPQADSASEPQPAVEEDKPKRGGWWQKRSFL